VRFRLKVWVATLLIVIVPIIPVYLAVLINNLYIVPDACVCRSRYVCRSDACSIPFPSACGIPEACSKNYFTGKPIEIGLLQDYGWYWYQFISWPATILFFLWFPKGILGAINGLRENKVLVVSSSDSEDLDTTLAKFTTQFARSYSRPIWLIASFVALVAFMWFYFLPDQKQYITWITSGWFIFGYTELFSFFILFPVFLIVIRASIAVVWFNLLFRKFGIDVNFLHPDKAGGLMPFGSLLVKGGYFIGIYGCTLMVLIIEAPYRAENINFSEIMSRFEIQNAVIPMAVLYFLFAPTLFFSALGSAHVKMKEARDKFVLRIANQYKDKVHCLDSSLGCSDLNEVKGNTEALEQLKKAYAIASDCPTWPINTRNVFRFYSSYLAPVILAVSLMVIERLLQPPTPPTP
jgi:hypothetical protein